MFIHRMYMVYVSKDINQYITKILFMSIYESHLINYGNSFEKCKNHFNLTKIFVLRSLRIATNQTEYSKVEQGSVYQGIFGS